jgi:hypothetical protein
MGSLRAWLRTRAFPLSLSRSRAPSVEFLLRRFCSSPSYHFFGADVSCCCRRCLAWLREVRTVWLVTDPRPPLLRMLPSARSARRLGCRYSAGARTCGEYKKPRGWYGHATECVPRVFFQESVIHTCKCAPCAPQNGVHTARGVPVCRRPLGCYLARATFDVQWRRTAVADAENQCNGGRPSIAGRSEEARTPPA